MPAPYKDTLVVRLEDVVLQGVRYVPRGPSKGEIFFVHGISADIDKYGRLLSGLASRYYILAFNQRGHGNSNGKLDPPQCAEDLVEIAHRYPAGRRIIMGHSMGSAIAVDAASDILHDKLVLLTPFVDRTYLPWHARAGILCLDSVRQNWFSEKLDGAITLALEQAKRIMYLKRGYLKNISVRNPIHAYGSLNTLSLLNQKVSRPIWYCISDQDYVLGTFRKKRYAKYKAALDALGDATDGSHCIKGLNHCFNKSPWEFLPVYKREDKKESLIEAIFEFLG